MSINKDANPHYQRALAYKEKSQPAEALSEIRAAIAMVEHPWRDRAAMVEFSIIRAWACLCVEEQLQADLDLKLIQLSLKIDPTFRVNEADLNFLVDGVHNWKQQAATPEGTKAELSRIYAEAWKAFKRGDVGHVSYAITTASNIADSNNNKDYWFLLAWTYFAVGNEEAALEVLSNFDRDENQDYAQIIQLEQQIESSILKKQARLEQAEVALIAGDLPGVLAAFSDVEKTLLSPSLMQKSVRLHTTIETSGRSRSKLGGYPDLPSPLSWPAKEDGTLLSFICQIDLSELNFDIDECISKTGTLFFFYDADEQPWGMEIHGGTGWKVLFSTANEKNAAPINLDPPVVFDERLLRLEYEETLPSSASVANFGLVIPQLADYQKATEAHYGEEPWHRMFGHASLFRTQLLMTISKML